MAIMIPGMQVKEEFNGSGGELLLYERLQQLPDSYYVFHSTHWNEKRRRNEFSRRSYIEWGEADFTIFHPTYGIIVFEVKDGEISYSRECGWIQRNRNDGTEKSIDPLQQAEKSKYFFLDQIKKRMGGSSPYSLCSAVWFTACDKVKTEGNLPFGYNDENVLWANDMVSATSMEQAIRRVYRFYDVREVQPNDELTKNILDIFAPEFGAFQSMRSRTLAAKALFHKMTSEQAGLLDYLDEQEFAAIHGMAGTGKTVLAVQKAQRLAENDNVLFLCFNRFLKDHLLESYENPRIEFNNLDGLYTEKVHEPLPDDSEERKEVIFDFLLDWKSMNWTYKHIIVDEGQDFCDEHLQALQEIAESKKGCFYVFYDRNQFVQGRSYPEWLDKMDCRLVLSRNCRNTKEIAITSTRPIGIAKEHIKLRKESVGTTYALSLKPTIFLIKSKAELKEDLVKLIKKYHNAGIPKSGIVILSCKPEGYSLLEASDYYLTPAYRLSSIQNNSDILFTTVRKFKGLEADAIICIDIDEETFCDQGSRNAFYVGSSRATTYLDLISLTTSEKLSKAITGTSITGPRSIAAISAELCVKIGTQSDLNAT